MSSPLGIHGLISAFDGEATPDELEVRLAVEVDCAGGSNPNTVLIKFAACSHDGQGQAAESDVARASRSSTTTCSLNRAVFAPGSYETGYLVLIISCYATASLSDKS
ncbi:hypothetical protein EDB86DRAFT_2834125 [Lactarius hatsudake]|nr:hypothetical protein EDB86DRAFT_2834125 [Lactarius hatsudake]